MEKKTFTLTRIEGEYAYLRELGNPAAEELFIALALLPIGADLGSLIEYENFTFTLIG